MQKQIAVHREADSALAPPVTEAPRLELAAAPAPKPHEWRGWAHALAQGLGQLIVQKPRTVTLRFGLVRTPEELAAVGAMRLRVYQAKLPYLLQELSENGLDAYDAHSFIFAIWHGNQVVATIRATRYPYETSKYVPESDLAQWLGKRWNTKYLEWGRLLVETTSGVNRLTPAIITYAAVYLHASTGYRHYFGYTRPHVRSSFGKFQVRTDALTFRIPARGEHSYQLLKGSFLYNVLYELPRWLSSFATQIGQRIAQRAGARRLSPPPSPKADQS
ncbi:hypothetical protein POL68_10450 [Stigmatella sp. ncwal1]|uniref:Uncharacterized protein n=1 Tax=Stigmatella ashevillensis TaxID=2995309 RepID=A0ABT5D9F8_9BACT|nr:hypothetical protein [Stigmatella ashevillena]MDC0708886.1 hypothetical protein [Stigmatella ashevillena]